jgi:N6-adenosine-specific RNA methylase IME4
VGGSLVELGPRASRFVSALDTALQVLATATTPSDLMKLADTAEALRVYARRAALGLVAQNKAAELRLRAERKIGEYLAQTPRHQGGRPLHPETKPVKSDDGFPRLSDLGISRQLSHRAQRLAEIPATEFDEWLQQAHDHQIEITTRLLLTICEQHQAAARNRERIVGGQVNDLIGFACSHKVGTIMIDPPWPNGGWVLPYMTTTLDELQRLPIRDLANPDRCHLHIWSLPNENIFALKPIIEGWGFRLVSSLAWVKPATLGRGNYWRTSHKILLTCIWADRNDRFDDHTLRSWIDESRGPHSEKPELVRQMIERASPPPRLELFARKLVPNWFCWGHEIADRLQDQELSQFESDLSPAPDQHPLTTRPVPTRPTGGTASGPGDLPDPRIK